MLLTLTDLVCLSLVTTDEKKELSRPFGRFPKLQWLDLTSNTFSPWDIHPPSDFTALRTLHIADYDSYMVEKVLCQLASLRQLHITTPNVHEINQRSLQRLGHVRIEGKATDAFERHVGLLWSYPVKF